MDDFDWLEISGEMAKKLSGMLEACQKSQKELTDALSYYKYRHPSTMSRIKAIIPAIYNEYLWTMNLPYIQSVCAAVIRAIELCESKFEMGFGGGMPQSNEFGIFPARRNDITATEDGYYVMDTSECLIITGLEPLPPFEGLVPHSTSLDPGSQKLGPLTPLPKRGRNTFLLPYQIIIEPRSSLRGAPVVWFDPEKREWWIKDGDLGSIIGFWLMPRSRMLIYREKKFMGAE